MRGWVAGAILTGVLFPVAKADSFKTRCLSFKPESYVFNSTRTQLQYVPAGTNLTFPGNDETCDRADQVVSADLCRVALSVPTSKRSSITFEMWLPKDWSGRFLATGNGGIDGCIKYEDLAYTTQHGFSAVGSNNGHNGTYGDAFYQNADVVTDFAWRSLHRSTIIGKKLVKKFYRKDYSNSYYLGCSLGGRQGFKSAEMFPDDFDGIVAGAPATDFNHLIAWRARFFTLTGAKGSEGFILPSIWNATIHKEVLKQCDGIDGATDGIIEDPSLCNFDPAQIQCQSSGDSNCLNSTQVETVRNIFSPFRDADNNLLYPAMQPGSEPMAIQKLYAGAPFSYSDDWYKYVIYNPTWNASTFTAKDAVKADQVNPANIRTWPSSLKRFQRIGGKIITFHGQQDQQITSFNTPRFYEHLRNGMRYSYDDMDEFLRFFRVSGMFHCNSGPGAWVIGQGGAAVKKIPFGRDNNVLAAMVDWVEQDIPPETIQGTKYVDDDADSGVAFTRRHCKWPLRNTFLGGESTDPDNWECRETEQGYIGHS
ncbi:tannase and feruloyl esterase [Lophiostoma macrostomum CBS 122681]|uniref:Carboxylic ester hydrolase n=1 Tax=Lophiostoma macrostomum CBS 122681 TaxID=1314788 RepID=A0A6A6SXB4_9PLEO|nr:tannase and feruloyl esterase [Lophiostoma macrostomum CBS 122681]